MTTLSATGAMPARTSLRSAPAGRPARLAAAGLALVASIVGAGVGTAVTATSADAGFAAFIERLEHARRVDDLRNQQQRWAR